MSDGTTERPGGTSRAEPEHDGQAPVPPDAVRRVCLFGRLRWRSLGDYIYRNIFLAQLRLAYPEAEIVHVVGNDAMERFGEFFSSHSHADTVLTCPDFQDDDPLRWERFFDGISGRGFDCCVVDPDNDGLGAREAARCGIAVRIGFAFGRPDDDFLTVAAPLTPPAFGLSDLLDFSTGLAAALGLEAPGAADVVPPFPFRQVAVPELTGLVVAVHPGGNWCWNRRWPLDRYGELCQALAAGDGAQLVLVGSAGEGPDLHLLRDMVEGAVPGARVVVSAGESLDTLASLLKRSDVLVGSDSAPAHVAAALGTPTVVLYGPSNSEMIIWDRIYLRHRSIDRYCVCLPPKHEPSKETNPCQFGCQRRYESAAGPYPRCMTAIAVDEVYRAVRQQLAFFSPTSAGV
ncbi:MAG TPA: glycosyltransferase family 9 protein [Streptosporangiaceae bacterium]|jgi:ADP-heptose:LPS heptosyltransferase|nr:glycosyltransferase family 9 protein [Streptosporangiaceae bacterium]